MHTIPGHPACMSVLFVQLWKAFNGCVFYSSERIEKETEASFPEKKLIQEFNYECMYQPAATVSNPFNERCRRWWGAIRPFPGFNA